MDTIVVKVDTSALAMALAKCTEPGVVLLPVSAQQKLFLRHGIDQAELEKVGGIVAVGEL